MAGEPREWADIDRAWLQGYLEESGLASAFDLDDVLIGSQVSWILNAAEWAKLRAAWEQERPAAGGGDKDQNGTGAEWLEAAPEGLELADEGLAEQPVYEAEDGSLMAQGGDEPVKEPQVAASERDAQLEDIARMRELTQRALGDWDAFAELFGDCPDSAGMSEWRTLAESPVALLRQAQELVSIQESAAAEERRQLEQAFEEEVTKAQNIIAGYCIYCRKHRLAMSLGHLLDFVPALRTGHSQEAVREAWSREAENCK